MSARAWAAAGAAVAVAGLSVAVERSIDFGALDSAVAGALAAAGALGVTALSAPLDARELARGARRVATIGASVALALAAGPAAAAAGAPQVELASPPVRVLLAASLAGLALLVASAARAR